jgi:hypothetical protein
MNHQMTCPRFWFGEPTGADARKLCGCLSITFAGMEIPCLFVEVDADDRTDGI